MSNNYFIDLKLFVFELKSFNSIKNWIEKKVDGGNVTSNHTAVPYLLKDDWGWKEPNSIIIIV